MDGFFVFSAKLELDIEEYSFSQTTLEQVFLKFSHAETDAGEWELWRRSTEAQTEESTVLWYSDEDETRE